MDNRPTRSSGHASRRTVLTWSAVTAGAIAASLVGCSENPQLTPTTSAPPKPSTTPTVTPPRQAKSILKFKDPRVIKQLERGTPTGGISRSYSGAFPAVNVKAIQTLTGLGTKSCPWVAASIVGQSNQLQIIDPRSRSVIYTVQIPESHIGGLETMAWDETRNILYLGTNEILYSWTPLSPKTVIKLGTVPGASSIYELSLDSQGNVWGGTYPSGCVFSYSATTKKIKVYPRLAEDSDYARRVAISSDDIIWVGTGAVNPRIFTFPAKDPERVTEIALPEKVTEGFISRISILGETVAISVGGIKEQLLLDPKSKKWIHRLNRVWAGREIAPDPKLSHKAYSVSNQQLYLTMTDSWAESILGAVKTVTPISIARFIDHIILVSQSTACITIEVFDLVAKKSVDYFEVPLNAGELTIQSLLSHSDGNIYLGGYMGDRLAAIDPSTGKSWVYPTKDSPINQIEGMIEFDGNRTFIGSYNFADLILMDTTRRDDPASYKHLVRLATAYHQSRPFGWAKNSKKVFFGTVPSYGVSGGIVGMIDPESGNVEWVLDGNGHGFIRNHSIISLAADEDFLYGTTSVRNGFGIPDSKGPAYVFKLDIKRKKIIWKSKPIHSADALYSATLLPGWLVVADIEGIVIIDVSDGSLVRQHPLTGHSNSSRRPGWASADIAVFHDESGLVHSASGVATLVDFETGYIHRIGKERHLQFGSRVSSAPGRKVYGIENQTTLIEFDLRPQKRILSNKKRH